MAFQYIYNEPTVVERDVFYDQAGTPHLDRDAAIAANMKADLVVKLREALIDALPGDLAARGKMAARIADDIATPGNPMREIARALIEGTD